MPDTKALTKKQLLAILDDFADDMPFFLNPDGEEAFPLRRSMFVLADDFRSVTIDMTGDPDAEEAEDDDGAENPSAEDDAANLAPLREYDQSR